MDEPEYLLVVLDEKLMFRRAWYDYDRYWWLRGSHADVLRLKPTVILTDKPVILGKSCYCSECRHEQAWS